MKDLYTPTYNWVQFGPLPWLGYTRIIPNAAYIYIYYIYDLMYIYNIISFILMHSLWILLYKMFPPSITPPNTSQSSPTPGPKAIPRPRFACARLSHALWRRLSWLSPSSTKSQAWTAALKFFTWQKGRRFPDPFPKNNQVRVRVRKHEHGPF